MDLASAVALFVDNHLVAEDRSDRTIAAYGIDLRQFTAFVAAETPVANVTAQSIEAWAAALRVRGYAPASRRRKLGVLRSFFRYCELRGFVAQTPFLRLRIRIPFPRQLPRCLTDDETRLLLHAAKTGAARCRDVSAWSNRQFLRCRNLAIVALLLETGIRVGELRALAVGDVGALDGGFLVHGKGRRQRLGFVTDEMARSALRHYLKHRCALVPEHEALFLNARGDGIREQGVADAIRRVAESAGIDRRVTPHMLRHTAATLLLRSGADLRVVQEFLGHASVAMTQRYTHVAPSHLAASLRQHRHLACVAPEA